MTLTFGQVRTWNAELLESVFNDLRARKNDLLGLQDELDGSANPQGWEGPASEKAAAAHKKLVDRLERLVAELSAAQRAIGDTADAVSSVSQAISAADNLAMDQGYRISDKGEVVEAIPVPDRPPDAKLIKNEIRDRVRQIMRRAKDIDHDLAALLAKAADGRIDVSNATTLAAAAMDGDLAGDLFPIGPPKDATVGASAGWWATLTAEDKRWVLETHPEWIGNRDGIPAGWRHRANMIRLDTELAKLNRRRDQLKADLADNILGGVFTNDDKKLKEVEAKLRSLNALKMTMEDPRRQLLLLDTSHGEEVRAAVATGHVDKAEDVAVFVPGVGTEVDAQDLNSHLKDMAYLQAEADLLNGDKRDAAVIWWLGYDPPDHVLQAPVPGLDAAHAGADDLTNFLRGVNAAAPNDPHLTLVGHSLGSTTSGLALQTESGVDDLVVAGSPGLGTNNFDSLKVPDDHMFVLETNDDHIADSHWFGKDPSWNPDATDLATGSATGHSEYFDKGTASAANTAAVIAGAYNRS